MTRMVSWQKHEGGRRAGKRGHKHNCAAVALAILTGMPYAEARKLREDEDRQHDREIIL